MISCVLLPLLLYSCYAEPLRDVHRHRVVVVGAGVSGFTAAATLLEHNVTDIIILEAGDRIGGRINTVEFGGVTIDEGAEFCHGQVGNAVYELISSYDMLTSYLPMVRPDLFLFASPSGSSFNNSQIAYLLFRERQIYDEDGIQHFKGSVADYYFPRLDSFLSALDVEPHLQEAMHHFTPLLQGVYTSADDLADLGPWGYSQNTVCAGDQLLKWKNGTGGYKRIFDFISKKSPNPLNELPVVNKTVLGKQVVRIEREGKDMMVKCSDDSTYLADHVIVTVSLGVLKKHAVDMFHPALPADKIAAIESLGFGCVAKIFILFPNKWWPDQYSSILPLFSTQELQDFQENSVHGSWSAYTTGFYPVMNHNRMLCMWFHGQACRTVESITEDEVIDGVLELLRSIVGDKYDIPRPESILRSNWGSDPLFLGADSFATLASDRLNITNRDLARPVLDENNKPIIMFAGEATHPQYYSNVHGALAAGRREALNLIDFLKKQQH